MFLAPELSAQFITAPTGRARDMRYLDPVAAAMERISKCQKLAFNR